MTTDVDVAHSCYIVTVSNMEYGYEVNRFIIYLFSVLVAGAWWSQKDTTELLLMVDIHIS